MKPINNYENVQAAGNIESLPAGGYVCEIKQCKEVNNRNTPGTHLEIMFEVCEGDFRGFFEADYRNQDREDKFWRGLINQNIPDESSPKYAQQCKFFKRFTNTVEDSNPGYHWDWNEAGLKGKRIGVLFGEKEKKSQRGTVYIITEAREIVPVDDIRAGRYKVPEKKTLAPEASYGGYGGFTPVADDDSDLPF